MSEERKTADADGAGEDDNRRQLWVRAGMAVGLIGLLLGGLAVFDHQSRPPVPDEEVALPTKPIAPAQVAAEAGRDAPPDVLRAGGEAAAPQLPAPAEEAPAPSLPPDARAGRAERLERPAGVVEGTRPPTRPAQGAVAPAVPAGVETVRKPDAPVVPAAPQQAVAPAPRSVTAAAAPAAAQAPAPAPAAATAAARPSPAASAQAPATGAAAAARATADGAYYLPLGTFPTAEQAEVLRARLSAEGVPSHLETRVLVGPFADRRDALAAQARLREKGFTPGELLPFRR